jgi:hypothetical protein
MTPTSEPIAREPFADAPLTLREMVGLAVVAGAALGVALAAVAILGAMAVAVLS